MKIKQENEGRLVVSSGCFAMTALTDHHGQWIMSLMMMMTRFFFSFLQEWIEEEADVVEDQPKEDSAS